MNPLEQAVHDFVREGKGQFEELAMAVYQDQRLRCPAYAAFCASQPSPRHWSEIPAVPLSAFRQTAIRTFPPEEIVRTFRTSGTTGEGFGEHHFRTLELYRAAVEGGWDEAGLPRQGLLSLVPSPDETPHSSLSCMAGWLVPRDQFYPGDWDRLERELAGRSDPVMLFGTALAFLDWFEHLGGRSVALPAGSLALETGGYKGTRRDIPKLDLYALFTARLGLPADAVWNEYGMTELSSQFYSSGLGRPHQGAPWVRALVIDPETGREVAEGQTGLLRIFDLANVGSCLAVQTRDLAVRRAQGFELIGRDPAALPRGCSRAADEMLSLRRQ